MIRMICAFTAEIDDPDAAVSEILGQLDLESALLGSSVGIVSCHSEFIESGVVARLCRDLPFDVVGATTLGNSACGKYGVECLSISVITADDVSFGAVYSAPLTASDTRGQLSDAYENALSGLRGEPRLAFAFAPFMSDISGNTIFSQLDEISGGLPLFGALACDHTLRYDGIRTFANGEFRPDALGLVVASGNIKPRFFSNCVSESRISKQSGIISDSDGCILKRVNGIPFMKYLTAQGFVSGCATRMFGAIPFLADYNDGTKPVARTIVGLTEEGHAIFGGAMPAGTALAIGSIDGGEAVRTAEKTVKDALETDEVNGMISFSGFTRCLMLGSDPGLEMRSAAELVGSKAPCHIAYAGGEICPVYGREGRTFNRFHNFSYVACVF
ncbi:MAG: FIST C-terminal domain-containing protein [Synergistaceae bacterium]|jgi:hypothetical protein|nr:FIST C-terminal domain-containing protein [Synergistaceae bacterium]